MIRPPEPPLRNEQFYEPHLKRPDFTVARTPLRRLAAFHLSTLFTCAFYYIKANEASASIFSISEIL